MIVCSAEETLELRLEIGSEHSPAYVLAYLVESPKAASVELVGIWTDGAVKYGLVYIYKLPFPFALEHIVA